MATTAVVFTGGDEICSSPFFEQANKWAADGAQLLVDSQTTVGGMTSSMPNPALETGLCESGFRLLLTLTMCKHCTVSLASFVLQVKPQMIQNGRDS